MGGKFKYSLTGADAIARKFAMQDAKIFHAALGSSAVTAAADDVSALSNDSTIAGRLELLESRVEDLETRLKKLEMK